MILFAQKTQNSEFVFHCFAWRTGSLLCSMVYFYRRCSVLDIQLKREPVDDIWSVSISHAAEVLQNWNLIGFQVLLFS